MPLTLLFLLLMLVQSSHAQEWQRAVNWNFGDKAALNFGTQPPISLGGSGMGAVEGCASISDTLGNLLFYSNGAAVWNKNHQIMENGNGLLGHVSSTQAALIVPQPGNDSLYYVFTTDALGVSDGFRYSIVNKNLAGGLGAVTTKNVLLQTSVCEKLAATKHANGRDVWILTHGFGNDIFYAYFLGERGITNCPIESRIGSYHGNGSPYAQGAMVFSNSGKRLAVCQYELNRIELFDFNASNGCLSNFKSAANQILPYSACFSPDEKVLYSSTRLNYIYQYSLQSQNSDSITASRQSLYNPPDSRHSYYCYIQQGLDNKLYLAMVDSNFLGIIHQPNRLGDSCQFEQKGIYLTHGRSQYGLPNFVSSYFYQPDLDFDYSQQCDSLSLYLKAKGNWANENVQWQITGADTLINILGLNAQLTLRQAGSYQITLSYGNYSQSKTINLRQPYRLYLGADTTLCPTEKLLLQADTGALCYQWHTGSSSNNFFARQAGLYHVSVFLPNGCVYHDSIIISHAAKTSETLELERKGDTLHCQSGFDHYLWYRNQVLIDSSQTPYHVMQQNGSYHAVGKDAWACFVVKSTPFVVDTLTYTNKIKASSFTIYPNPGKAGTPIYVEGANQIQSITDMLGRNIPACTTCEANNYTITFTQAGIYFIQTKQNKIYKIIIH